MALAALRGREMPLVCMAENTHGDGRYVHVQIVPLSARNLFITDDHPWPNPVRQGGMVPEHGTADRDASPRGWGEKDQIIGAALRDFAVERLYRNLMKFIQAVQAAIHNLILNLIHSCIGLQGALPERPPGEKLGSAMSAQLQQLLRDAKQSLATSLSMTQLLTRTPKDANIICILLCAVSLTYG